MDPNLIPAGSNANTAGLRANPLARPTEVAPYPFMGTTLLEKTYYYYCTIAGASMHRPDGKKIAFMFGICATNIEQDVRYLESEVADSHGYIRRATDEEVHIFKMKTDPKGTMTEVLKPQIEADIRAKVEEEIKQRLMGTFGVSSLDDLAKLHGTDKGVGAGVEGVRSGTATVVVTGDKSSASLATKQPTPQEMLAALTASQNNASRPPITPVSTTDIAAAAAGSAATK